MAQDPDNGIDGEALVIDSRNCLLRSDGPLIVAIGIEDLIVVATEGSVLVVPRDQPERLREAMDALAARQEKGSK